MSHARSQHPNAPLTPEGRRRMVCCVIDDGWTVTAAAERFQVDAKTVRKWRDRFLVEGESGLQDRSCRPRRSPNRTPKRLRDRVILVAAEATVATLSGCFTSSDPGTPESEAPSPTGTLSLIVPRRWYRASRGLRLG